MVANRRAYHVNCNWGNPAPCKVETVVRPIAAAGKPRKGNAITLSSQTLQVAEAGR